MTSKEKAKELVDRFKGIIKYKQPQTARVNFEILSAKICVQEIIKANPHSNPLNTQVDSTMGYWQEVLNHLNEM